MTDTATALLCGATIWLVLERLRWLRRLELHALRRGFGTDIAFAVLGFALLSPPTRWYLVTMTDTVASCLGPGLAAVEAPLWLLTGLSIVLLDLGGALTHRLLHRVDALWEFHKVHHSAHTLDWLATFRSHLVEQIVRRALMPLGLFAVGMPLPAVALALMCLVLWAMLGHANIGVEFRWLESVLITPRLHHLHHVPETTNRNFGTVLTCWDRVMGTLATNTVAADAPLGVPGERDAYPQQFVALLREPLRRSLRRARARLRRLRGRR